MPIRHDKKIAFVHITKTAGVAIANNFKMSVEGHHESYEFFRKLYPDYYTFAIVRNPYDRLVSAFEFMKKFDTENPHKARYHQHYKNGFKHLCENLNNYESLLLKPQYKFICDSNYKVMVDNYFYFEHDFWTQLYKVFGEKVEPKIYNSTNRRDYENYYTPETKKLVYDNYKKDFEIFNYKK